MEKRFNYRIYPNKEQEAQIQKNFGCVRFVYNYFLNKRVEKYKSGEGIYGYYDACKDLTRLKKQSEYAFLREADSHSLQAAIKNMDLACAAFFRRVREKSGAPGFPRFKAKRETRQSYTTRAQPGKAVIYLTENKIRLPKLGLVKCAVSRPAEGRVLSASVLRVPSGKYFASVCCAEAEAKPFELTGKEIGLHFGVKTLAVASDGRTFENRRFFERTQKKISRLARSLSRKPKDGANREKARVKLAKAYERAKNQKTDMLQKLTLGLVRDYDTICVRSARLAETARKRRFARYMADASWGELTGLLRYKCAWYGKTFVEIDARFPSAQVCSACGRKNAELGKKQPKKWVCPKCGAKHERALNAAVNTLNEGRRVLAAL